MDLDTLLIACKVFDIEAGRERGTEESGNISMSCPLAPKNHQDTNDRNLSCSVSYGPAPSLARCFSANCGFKGMFYRMLWETADWFKRPPQLIDFLRKLGDTEKVTIKAKLAAAKKCFVLGPDDPDFQGLVRLAERGVLDEHTLDEFKTDQPHPYMLQRGITAETCARWQIGFDRRLQRVTFPIRRLDGALVGVSGRDVTGTSDHRYHNYVGVKKSNYLFGEHMLQENKPVIIVEGQFDAVRTSQNLPDYTVVAPLGEGFTAKQVETLAAARPSYITLFTDHDSAGKIIAEKIAAAIDGRIFLKITLPPPDMDPGELEQAQAQAAIAASIPILNKIRWDRLGFREVPRVE